MTVPIGKRIRRSARSALLRGAIRLLGLLPFGLALRLGRILGRAAYRVARKTRRLTLAHLAMAFPELTEVERRSIARDMFVHLGCSAMELVSIRRIDTKLERYIAIDGQGEPLLKEVMARGRGMIFVTGHLGNWELLARRVARAGVHCVAIAKAGADGKLNALVERFRATGGIATIWREDRSASRAIIRTLRDGKVLGLLVDQDTRVQGIFVPFFGKPAFTPRAPGDLALRFRAPVVVGTCHRRGTGGRDGHIVELTEVPFDADPVDREAETVRIVAACSALLEDAIRRHPAEWVWMHERWKTAPEKGKA